MGKFVHILYPYICRYVNDYKRGDQHLRFELIIESEKKIKLVAMYIYTFILKTE